MLWRSLLLCLATALMSQQSSAQSLELHGFADVRFVSGADETSWTQGGLGKTRYGDGENNLRFGAAALVANWQPAPSLLAVADVRHEPQHHASLSVVEAFLRYRPVSTDAWRWSVKVGEFFPPISLENEGVGWTSLWTLTPSAIDSWIGEEVRTIGGEIRIEHRGDLNTFEAGVAVIGANDPAGEILASRGWSLSDFVAGAGARLREPDVYANLLGAATPRRYDPFLEIDHRAGWYADVAWHSDEFGKVSLLYYDNRADPSDYHSFNHGDELFAWHTRFSSAGATTSLGQLVVIGQAMEGDTEIAPPGFPSTTHFSAGYLLLGWNVGLWRPALRFDAFTTRQDPASSAGLREHGNAITLALNWRPSDWLRLTCEVLRVDSTRGQRLALGLAPQQIDNQIMLNARTLF